MRLVIITTSSDKGCNRASKHAKLNVNGSADHHASSAPLPLSMNLQHTFSQPKRVKNSSVRIWPTLVERQTRAFERSFK